MNCVSLLITYTITFFISIYFSIFSLISFFNLFNSSNPYIQNSPHIFYTQALVISLTFILLTGLSLNFIFAYSKRIDTRLLKINSFRFLLIVFITFLATLYFSSLFPAWSDEFYQMEESALDPYFAALIQHQMPLSYILSFSSYKLLGAKLISIRIGTIFIFAFSIGLIFEWLHQYLKSYVSSITSALLLISHPLIFRYSFEARPQSTSLLFFFLFLVITFNLLSIKNLNKKQILLHLCVSILFLLSIGFQPPIFLFFFILAMLVFYTQKLRSSVKSIFLYSTIPSVLIYLYFIFVSIKYSDKRLHSMSFKNLILDDFINFHIFPFDLISLLNTVYILIPFIFATLYLNKLKRNSNPIKIASTLLFASLLFMYFTYNIFIHHIKWEFFPKYLYIAVPVLYFSLIIVINESISIIATRYNINAKAKPFILVLILLLCFKVNSNQNLQAYFDARVDSNLVYEIIQNRHKPNDTIYCFHINNPELPCSGLTHAANYYSKARHSKRLNIMTISKDSNLSINNETYQNTNMTIFVEAEDHLLEVFLPNFSNFNFVRIGPSALFLMDYDRSKPNGNFLALKNMIAYLYNHGFKGFDKAYEQINSVKSNP